MQQTSDRYERNRRYYLKNKTASMRSTLLHNVKTMGRVPRIYTMHKYKISPDEFMNNYRVFLNGLNINLSNLPEDKKVKIAAIAQQFFT